MFRDGGLRIAVTIVWSIEWWYTSEAVGVFDVRADVMVYWVWCVRILCMIHRKMDHRGWLVEDHRSLVVNNCWPVNYH